jgi:hypothetical protein
MTAAALWQSYRNACRLASDLVRAPCSLSLFLNRFITHQPSHRARLAAYSRQQCFYLTCPVLLYQSARMSVVRKRSQVLR